MRCWGNLLFPRANSAVRGNYQLFPTSKFRCYFEKIPLLFHCYSIVPESQRAWVQRIEIAVQIDVQRRRNGRKFAVNSAVNAISPQMRARNLRSGRLLTQTRPRLSHAAIAPM
jgi:hypothetical protein